MAAIDALSTYNLNNSRLDRSHHRDLRHVGMRRVCPYGALL